MLDPDPQWFKCGSTTLLLSKINIKKSPSTWLHYLKCEGFRTRRAFSGEAGFHRIQPLAATPAQKGKSQAKTVG